MFKFLISLSCLFFVAQAYSYNWDGHIINMGEPMFNTAVSEFSRGLFVYFYEPDCSPCKHAWPEIQKAANELFDSKSAVTFGKIDCHDETKACSSRNVQNLPTMILYRNGKDNYEYRGPKTAPAIKRFIRNLLDSQYDSVENEVTAFLQFTTVLLVNQVSSQINEAYKNLFEDVDIFQAAGALRDKLGENVGGILTQSGQLVEISRRDPPQAIISKVYEIQRVQKAGLPNFGARDIPRIQGKDDQEFVFFFRTNKFDPMGSVTQAYDKVARKFGQDKLQFFYVNPLSDGFGNMLGDWFGARKDSNAIIGIWSRKNGSAMKYRLEDDGETDEAAITEFINSYKKNLLERYYMSADAPRRNVDYVYELVGNTFKSVTQDPSKNVFVMFYMPYCYWCKKLEPMMQSLSYRVRNNPNIVFAKIDMSVNDVEGQEFKDYPAFIFYPAGENKKSVVFNNVVSVSEIKKFLKKYIPDIEDQIEL